MHWIVQVLQATKKVFLYKEDWWFATLQFYIQTFSNLISASLNLAIDSCEVPILIIPTSGFASAGIKPADHRLRAALCEIWHRRFMLSLPYLKNDLRYHQLCQDLIQILLQRLLEDNKKWRQELLIWRVADKAFPGC